jgi:hypothetical protein
MRRTIVIEDIEGMRRRVGIDDVELREEIRGLRVGDLVKITLLTGTTPRASETVPVKITDLGGYSFRGRLAGRPTSPGLSGLRPGFLVAFTAAHIHSLPKGSPTYEHGR